MTAAVTEDHFSGGTNLQKGHGTKPDAAAIIRDISDDIGLMRTALLNLGTKLDNDVGVTDVDYNSTIATDLATQLVTKG